MPRKSSSPTLSWILCRKNDHPISRDLPIYRKSLLFFTGLKHKILLPTDPVSFATGKLYDTNDNVIEGKEAFFRDNAAMLMKIQIDSSKFNN